MISTRSVRVIRQATVVIDLDGAAGLPLDAVSQYASLVALAEIRPGGAAPTGSILSLFETGSDQRSLSDLDRAFLRALYRMAPDRGGRVHRARLTSAMTAAQLGEASN